MKVCLVTGIFPPDIGGPATYVSKLARYLQSNGWEVEVITYADSPGGSDQPFPVHRVVRSRSGVRRFLRARKLIKQAAKRSDIVYVNGLLSQAASALKRSRVPRVAKIVGDWAWERAQNKGLTHMGFEEFQATRQRGMIRVWQTLRKRSLGKMDRILVPSEFLRRTVEGWGFHGKVEVIYNGVASDYGREFAEISPATAKQQLGLKGRVVLSIGRLVRWKGFGTLVRLLRRLDEEVSLVIVGDGPLREELGRTADDAGVSGRVAFAGRVDHEEVPLYFRAAECFVLNSDIEGFPHIALEAMAMKCPVVAAATGGTPELVEDRRNGILVNNDDEEGIVSAIQSIRNDPKLRSTIIHGGLSDAARFSWEKTASETLNLLEGMV